MTMNNQLPFPVNFPRFNPETINAVIQNEFQFEESINEYQTAIMAFSNNKDLYLAELLNNRLVNINMSLIQLALKYSDYDGHTPVYYA